MKVIYTYLAVAGWAWLLVLAGLLLAQWYNIRFFPRLWASRRRGLDVAVNQDEKQP
jgi:hypothetical protein